MVSKKITGGLKLVSWYQVHKTYHQCAYPSGVGVFFIYVSSDKKIVGILGVGGVR